MGRNTFPYSRLLQTLVLGHFQGWGSHFSRQILTDIKGIGREAGRIYQKNSKGQTARQEQEFLWCRGVKCACVTAEKEPTQGLGNTENTVTRVLSSCDWRQEENLRKNETKMWQRSQDSKKEGTPDVETGTNPKIQSVAMLWRKKGQDLKLWDEFCSQNYPAKGSLPSHKHRLHLMFLLQQARGDKLKLRT